MRPCLYSPAVCSDASERPRRRTNAPGRSGTLLAQANVMDPSEFPSLGHEMVDLLTEYFEDIEEKRVFPDVEPQHLQQIFDEPLPQEGTAPEAVLRQIEEKLLPYCTHVGHPG